MMASSSIACQSRPCVPLFCPNARPRAARGRWYALVARRSRRTKASIGDASFPFLPRREETGEKKNDDEQGPSLVPIDPDSTSLLSKTSEEEGYDADGLFGPLALLAVGLEAEALRALAGLLEDDLGARGVVPTFAATEEMLDADLRSAFEEASGREEELCIYRNNDSSAFSAPPASVTGIAPRSSVERPAVCLSGMSAPEVVSIVSAWRDSGNSEKHGEVLFCAAVPSNWTSRTLKQLVEDIAGDAAAVEER